MPRRQTLWTWGLWEQESFQTIVEDNSRRNRKTSSMLNKHIKG